MTEQNEAYKRLTKILEELFQLDQADLDFGIYRIMNQKRDEVNDFLKNRLVAQVKEILDEHADKDKDKLRKELESLKKTLTDAGVDVSTNEKVQQLERQVSQADTTDLQNSTFSHLTNFFKRYYKEGDFISQRRYKDDVYAIPYQGEEVKLHWANHDQYYIKTSEYFKNYRFKLRNGKWINFELLEASTEQNNNKSQNGERKFKLAEENVYREDGDTLTIYFTYEPMSKSKKQDKLMDQAFETIKEEVPQTWLTELLQPKPTEKNKKRTLLEKHLKDYTARNTFDYFIHKDLGKFLRRELDFYVKNEILHIDDIDLDKDESYREALQVIIAFKKVGLKIIDFLTQLEEFQKKLWLKKKFVLKSDYCITLDRIDEEFYEEIAANDQQRKEWVKLYAIDELDDYSEPLSADFLKNNPFLMVDTKFYSQEWKYELLATFDQLEELTGGLMINSENFQALKLLENQFRNEINGVYIDPPYNTGDDGFCYKDNFKSSSWLSMIDQTLPITQNLLSKKGAFFSSCDEHQFIDFGKILNQRFGENNHVETITWNKRVPKNDKGIGNIHEYIYLFAKDQDYRRSNDMAFLMRKDGIEGIYEYVEKLKKQGKTIEETKAKLKKYYKKQGFDRGITLYCELDHNYEIWGKINMSWPSAKTEGPRYEVINPVTGKPAPIPDRGWRWKEDTFRAAEKDGPKMELPDGSMMVGRIWYSSKENIQPSSITYLKEVESFLLRSIISLKSDGSIHLENFGLGGTVDYPKPPKLLEWLFYSIDIKDGWFLDYFAGSGTTGEAIMRSNRLDHGSRKYIQIDMGDHFSKALVPRLKKSVYSDSWNNGKPIDREGISHMFKYLRLESYEDTLNNLSLSRTEQQQQLLANEDLKEEYILNYMLDVEAKESLLNTEMFKRPFGYSIEATQHNERVPTEVDLVETFNYLIGLHVVSIQIIKGYVVVTGHNNDGEHILVIWRDTEKHSNEDLEKFVNTMEFNPLDGEFDTIYVNGDNNLQNLRKDEDTWKVRLIEEEFHKRMFETEGL